MDGGFFLVHRFDVVHGDREVKGLEVIGFERGFGAEPSMEIVSRIFDNEGNTFRCVYEVGNETLAIGGAKKGLTAYHRGLWREDGNVCAGAWVYLGGGYESTMRRTQGREKR